MVFGFNTKRFALSTPCIVRSYLNGIGCHYYSRFIFDPVRRWKHSDGLRPRFGWSGELRFINSMKDLQVFTKFFYDILITTIH